MGGTEPRRTHGPPPPPSTGPRGPRHDGAPGTEPGCALLGPPPQRNGLAGPAPKKDRTPARTPGPARVLEPIRGNVDTRVRRRESGPWDALILAAAGLSRLGLTPRYAWPLDPTVFVPAVGQGIVAIEMRAADRTTRAWIERIDHAPTRVCALAERAYLGRLGASCNTPMAAHPGPDEARLRVTAVVAGEGGRPG